MVEPPEVREVIVRGTPRSLQSSRKGRAAWKREVERAAIDQHGDDTISIQWTDVAVMILHLCPSWEGTTPTGDLDNLAKPILDASATAGACCSATARSGSC